MRIRWIILSIIFCAASLVPSQPIFAQDVDEPAQPVYEESYDGMPICAPGIYLIPPIDCLPLGPSQTLTSWAEKGITLPFKPLPASHPDSSYLELDKKYAKLNLPPGVHAAYYPNIESAVQGWGALSTLPIGETLYVSYHDDNDVSYVNGNPFVSNERDEWIRASPTTYSSFQGMLLKRPPENDFGWIVDVVWPQREPSYYAAPVNEELFRETEVQVYDQVEAEGTTWYMIGIGKWVERRAIRVVSPRLSPPEGVENGRWIEVNLYEQTLTVYEDSRLLFATLIGSGFDPYYTQPGLFQIREKLEYETMTGSFVSGKADFYYLENVPWTMYYDGPRALHGAYWRALFGYELSHGCVNLPVGDAHWLFDWVEVGDWVYVWDPSGKTPTDPAFYQEGVAF
jgi:hypothetical protein